MFEKKMTDRLTSEKRSWNMSRIHGKDTAIEVKVRKRLFSHGYRYRKNDKRLPGKPDIVLPKYKTVIFIHGCFWHRHTGCKNATMPKTRAEFWQEKFNRNVENDKLHMKQLEESGWQVITLWECEINRDFDLVIDRTERQLKEKLQNECQINGKQHKNQTIIFIPTFDSEY